MKKIYTLAIISVFGFSSISLAPQLTTAQVSSYNYKTYINARYSYSIAYPVKLLIPQGEAQNGDGQKFLSPDGRAEMLVYGKYNHSKYSVKQLYALQLRGGEFNQSKNRVVTYKLLKDNWFIVSGFEGGKVFYEKIFIRKDTDEILTLQINYPKSQKTIYDAVTARIAKSFRI